MNRQNYHDKCSTKLNAQGICTNCNGQSVHRELRPIPTVSVKLSPVHSSIEYELLFVGGLEAGSRFVINECTTIGREKDNEIVIVDRACSRHHAVIQKLPNGIYIKDLNTGNGIYVNGHKVNGIETLHIGDEITIANQRMKIKLHTPTNIAEVKDATTDTKATAPPTAPTSAVNYAAGASSTSPVNVSEANATTMISTATPSQGITQPLRVAKYSSIAHNPQRTTAQIWLVMFFAFLSIGATPFMIEMDMMRYGFAIIFFSLFLCIVAIVSSLVYFKRAAELDHLLTGKELLAHWTYTPQEWQQYSETEFQIAKSEKVPLLILTNSIMLGIGFIFLVTDPAGGKYVFMVMGILALILSMLVYFLPRLRHQHNLKSLGEAFIGTSSAYLNGIFHNWNMLGSRLEKVVILSGSPLLFAITYSFVTRAGRQEETLRIPIPHGQEKSAQDLVLYFH